MKLKFSKREKRISKGFRLKESVTLILKRLAKQHGVSETQILESLLESAGKR